MRRSRRNVSSTSVVPANAGVFVDADTVGATTRSRAAKRPRGGLRERSANCAGANQKRAAKKDKSLKAAKKQKTKHVASADAAASKEDEGMCNAEGEATENATIVKSAAGTAPAPPLVDDATGNSASSTRTSATARRCYEFRDIDAKFRNKPLYVTEYVNDMFSYFAISEEKHMPRIDYMTSVQTDINSQMRGILVDWLVEVADEYKLLPQTLYLCVNLIDRCLSKFRVSRSKLQLLGCACMLLAAKYEEIYSPQVEEFVYISDNTYTDDQVRQMESKVLNVLDFQLTVPTPMPFLSRFLRAADATEEETRLSKYLCELALLSYEMIAFKPSLVAASAIYLARYTLRSEAAREAQQEPADPARYLSAAEASRCWTETMQHYSGFDVVQLQKCVRAVHKLHLLAPPNPLKAVREKYSSRELFGGIATRNALSASALPCEESLVPHKLKGLEPISMEE